MLTLKVDTDPETMLKNLSELSEEIRRFLREDEGDGGLLLHETLLLSAFHETLSAFGPKGSNILPANEYKKATGGLLRLFKGLNMEPLEVTRAARLKAAASGNLLPTANKTAAKAIVLTKEQERFAEEMDEWVTEFYRALSHALVGRKELVTNETLAADAAAKGHSELAHALLGERELVTNETLSADAADNVQSALGEPRG